MSRNPDSVHPKGGWFDQLTGIGSVEILGQRLRERYPACAEGLPREVAILGASSLTAPLLSPLVECGTRVLGLFDHDPAKHGQPLGGATIQPFEALASLDPEIPVVAATHRLGRAWAALEATGVRHVLPYPLLHLLAPDAIPGHPFYAGLHESLLDHRARLERLFSLLCDEFSRLTLDRVIGFRMTFDPRVLEGCLVPDAYFALDALELGESEFLVDGGAFNGDTTALFQRVTGGRFRGVLAVEPSRGPYEELRHRFAEDPRIRPVQACLNHERAVLTFDTADSRVSACSDTGEPVQGVPIDALEEADGITFIKLNIEGAEGRALSGASSTIQRYGPRLAIAVYHRPDDLWSIPEQIESLRSDYRFLLRQHDAGLIETVLYAVVPRTPDA